MQRSSADGQLSGVELDFPQVRGFEVCVCDRASVPC